MCSNIDWGNSGPGFLLASPRTTNGLIISLKHQGLRNCPKYSESVEFEFRPDSDYIPNEMGLGARVKIRESLT